MSHDTVHLTNRNRILKPVNEANSSYGNYDEQKVDGGFTAESDRFKQNTLLGYDASKKQPAMP